jgi:hypothetical protein
MIKTNKNNCFVCGQELIYTEATGLNVICHYCGKETLSNVSCKNGHFVCDECHSKSGVELIESFCISSPMTDVMQMANTLMLNPAIKMHGPEHHFLVPAVLLAAWYNHRGEFQWKEQKIKEAKKRAKNVLGGFCGFYGTCGAAVGTGIFISLITNGTPLSDKAWSQANMMTSKALQQIAISGGPRCCKRDTFISLWQATDFIRKELDSSFPKPEQIQCGFSLMNKECLKQNCTFNVEAPVNLQ